MTHNNSTANYLARLEHSPTPDYHWAQSPTLKPQQALKLIEDGQGCVLHSGYDYLDNYPPDLTSPSFNVPPASHVTLPSIHSLLNDIPPVPGPLTLHPADTVAKKHSPQPDARQLIAQSAGKGPNKENQGPTAGKRERGVKKFLGPDLVQIARAVVEKSPFLEPYCRKTAGWKEVKDYLNENGFRHTVGHDVIRQKAVALVAYKKNPASKDEKVKAIASVLNGTTDLITIAALLKRMKDDWDSAQHANEDKKADLKKKHDKNRIGGDVIRQASMKGPGLRHHKHPVPSDTDSDNEGDNMTMTKSQSSFREASDTNAKNTSKRRRTKGREPSTTETLMHRMEEHESTFNARIDAYMAASEERAIKLENFLQEIVELETVRVKEQLR